MIGRINLAFISKRYYHYRIRLDFHIASATTMSTQNAHLI